jgi:gamma-glutamyl hercynylcysteine S-oxide synthase
LLTDNLSALPEPAELPPGTIRTDSKEIKQVWVPPGRCPSGSDPAKDKDARPDEQPQHEVRISQGFWLDMYPVTNAAYEQFIADGGYEKRAFWSADGWTWVVEKLEIIRANDSEGFTDPQQPRVGISWYEADAYARWRGGDYQPKLSGNTRRAVHNR